METAIFLWMAGGYVGQQVIQSKTGDKVKQVINNELDKLLEKSLKK